MCGIDGMLDPAGGVRRAVPRMNDCLRHRGPDDEGTWASQDGRVGLGHRRLAIIDLTAAGHQPMSSASGRYTIVFNGEVYNFERLRAALRPPTQGYRGSSDTEVLLEAFDQLGVQQAVARFEGMFAFAVWDAKESVLYLGRDRFGKKPLYYAMAGSRFVFASELKALMPELPTLDVDPASREGFLQAGYVMGPQAILRGVRRLPPGTWMDVRIGEPPGDPVPFWSPQAAVLGGRDAAARPEAAADQLESLLGDAVRDRLVSDVPLGAFLSGGVDSSTVVALMARHSDRVKTFTIAWDDPAYDESAHARAVAEHLRTEHHERHVSAEDAIKAVHRLADVYDEPFADASQVPTLLVCEAARRHVTVALSGDGGDEVFGGYNRYLYGPRLWRRARLAPRPVRAAVAGVVERAPVDALNAVGRRLGRALPPPLRHRLLGDKMRKAARVLRARDREDIHRILLSTGWPEGDLPPVHPDPSLPMQEWMMLEDVRGYLPDDILVKVDRASMAVGLEVRAPLLDQRVYEFAWRLPLDLRIRQGTTKWLLRQVLHRYVPRDLVERPKMGFAMPAGPWLRGPLRDWGNALLEPDAVRASGLDAAMVARLWSDHQSGRRDWTAPLWAVLVYRQWHDRWLA